MDVAVRRQSARSPHEANHAQLRQTAFPQLRALFQHSPTTVNHALSVPGVQADSSAGFGEKGSGLGKQCAGGQDFGQNGRRPQALSDPIAGTTRGRPCGSCTSSARQPPEQPDEALLFLGDDPEGTRLEVVGVELANGRLPVIHARRHAGRPSWSGRAGRSNRVDLRVAMRHTGHPPTRGQRQPQRQ